MKNKLRASFNTDGYILNETVIKESYNNAKINKQELTALTNIFLAIELANKDKEYPGYYANEITKLIKTKMIPEAPPQRLSLLDPKAVYPLSKNGALGVLYRECIIVDKGLQQRQGHKPPVLKQIVGFKNAIQTEKTKNNQKLQWFKDNKQYPFRIILRDNKNAAKGIYFKTVKQAEKVRIYYVNKFGYKGNITKLMQEPNRIFSQQCLEQFKTKLFAFKNAKKELQRSASLKQTNLKAEPSQPSLSLHNSKMINEYSRINESEMMKQQITQNILNKSLNRSNNKGYDTDMMRMLIDKEQSRFSKSPSKQKFDSQKITLLEKLYKAELFESWTRKAHEQEDSKQLEDAEQSIRDVNTLNMLSKSKFKNRYENPQKIQAPKPIEKKQSILTYKSIQFLRENGLFVKPIVTITLIRNGNIESQTKFNTIIQKKDPHLSYQLVPITGEQTHRLKYQINQYDLVIKAIDHLSNSEMCNDKIQLKTKVLSYQSLLTNHSNTMRLELVYDNGNQNDRQIFRFEDNPQGCFLDLKPLGQNVIEEIRSYWEKQAIRRSYYNISKDIRIIQIFELYEQPPKSWALGLSQSYYNIINLLNSASKILKFKLTRSIIPIIKAVEKLYSQFDELISVILAIIVNYMKPYYFISQFNKINKLHLLLGLEGELELPSKIALEMEIIRKIIKIECSEFEEEMKAKNIGYVHILYQYIYEMFSKNFSIRTLGEVWNFIFSDSSLIPVYMMLISVWLIKFYVQKLIKCNNFKEVKEVLESCETCPADLVIRQIVILRQKYFNAPNVGLMDSFKGMFNVKPLQQAVIEFYKRQTERLDRRKQNRTVEKHMILQKLSNEIPIELPKYPPRSYCLHIYFYKLPQVAGSLYIKANNIQYQCINIPRNRYFIIGEVNTEISLQFINNKSDQFTAKLQCIQGINKFTVELRSPKNNQTYEVQYICGLLTPGHIEALKKNRKFEHYIGSFIKQDELFDEFLRPINQCIFLNSFSKRLDKDDLGKKIKVIFSNGSKNFDEVQFYLHWICISPYTFPEKLKLIREYALNISLEYFLSDSRELEKEFIYQFLRIAQFNITSQQFKSYYADSIGSEFEAPKIMKCKLILPNGAQHQLETIANAYLCGKTFTHLHQDILINELIAIVQKEAESHLVNITEATINLIYFSFGYINSMEIPIIKKKSSKDFSVDDSKFQFQTTESNDINIAEPDVLMTETLPTFSKISTILDFVHSTKSVDNVAKTRQPHRKLAQPINLLKICDLKYGKVITMRYHSHPNELNIPFFHYFHELIFDEQQPELPKHFFLNNLQTDLKSICIHGGKLNFFDNKRIETTPLIHSYGLYGNLRIIPPKTDSLYFVTVFPEEQPKPNAQFFVNYGYGIYRWEPCIVFGYNFIAAEKDTHLSRQKKTKKQYWIRYKNNERYCKRHQLKLEPKLEQILPQLESKTSISKSSLKKPEQGSTIRKQPESKISSRSSGGLRRNLNF